MSRELMTSAGVDAVHFDIMDELLGMGISWVDLLKLYQLLRPYADLIGPALTELLAFLKAGNHTPEELFAEFLKLVDMVLAKLPA